MSRQSTPRPSSQRSLRAPRSADFSDANLNLAELKFLQWEGVQTRNRFTAKEEEIVEWIEQVTRREIQADTSDQLAESLKDGSLLCFLMNNLIPGSVPGLPRSTVTRVNVFLDNCVKIGVPREQLFHPFDIIYKRNTVHVIYSVHALAEQCHARRITPFFTGTQTERKKKKKEFQAKVSAAKSKSSNNQDGWQITTTDLPTSNSSTKNNAQNILPWPSPMSDDIIEEEPPSYEPTDTVSSPLTTTATPSQYSPPPSPALRQPKSPYVSPSQRIAQVANEIALSAEKFKTTAVGSLNFGAMQLSLFWVACIAVWCYCFVQNFV